MKKSHLMIAGSAVCLAAMSSVPTFAQSTTPTTTDVTASDADTTTEDASESSIVVTGSRIRRPNVESALPVTSVTGEEFFQQGQNNIGDTLNDLPQLRSTFAQQNPGAGVGIAGLSLLDLRGLGTVRTLVLVNGRRHVAADILNNASSPDVNTIPNDLIERVDIVTGGNSAVYGSDAIAGVVNFILRRDFDGIQLRGTGAVSEKGFGGNQYISGMVGKNFADGRGNITLHGEFANQERIYGSDIDFLRRVDGFATVDVDSPGLANASDGFPDAVFVRDIRSSTTHRFGFVAIPQTSTGTRPCGSGTLSNDGPPNTAGTAFNCNFIFNADGRLEAQTGTRFGSGPTGTIIGGNGQTGREGTLLSILPSMKRYNFNALSHFEVSEALEFFAEAKFARINTVGNQLGPTFLNNSTASLGNDQRLAPRLDNPYLNPVDRATLTAALLAAPCNSPVGPSLLASVCGALTPAALAARTAAIANGSYRLLFARTFADSPDRDEYFQRDTFRIVGGARGTFNGDWNYELSANYGKMKETADMRGFVNRQRFLLSLDAAIDPANVAAGVQCRSKFDPAARVGLPAYSDSAATLAADVAACVPYNVFGAGNNAAAVQYFKQNILNRASIDQLDILGYVNGDSSQLFELPGGPVRFVVGGEYRREKAFNNSDDAADNGISNSVFLGDVNAKPLTVKEAFGELQLPLLSDTPFFQDLTLSGAVRVSKYNNSAGTVLAYNGGVEWAPIDDIRFRANYGRSVRAPNSSETSFPSIPNFANGFIDPCNQNAIGLNPIRAINCAADLSAAQRGNLPLAGYSLGIISGSNPNLLEEKADSYTLGVVVQPSFVPGLSLTADYYDITVKNVIVTLTAQAIVNGCYDSPELSSPLCGVFARNRTAGNGAQGELPGQILNNTVVAGPNNFASRKRRGLDIELAYRNKFSDDFGLNTRLIYSHQFQNSNFQDPTNPKLENRILSELGDPKDEFRWNVDLTYDRVTFGYEMRFLGEQLTSTYENFYALPSACTTATPPICPPLNSDAFEIRKYPAVFYHDIRLDFAIGENKQSNFFIGVDNVLDTEPPLGTTATGAGSAIFNIRGRSFYSGFKARF